MQEVGGELCVLGFLSDGHMFTTCSIVLLDVDEFEASMLLSTCFCLILTDRKLVRNYYLLEKKLYSKNVYLCIKGLKW